MLSFLIISAFSLTIEPSEEKGFLRWMRETKQFYVGDEYHIRFGIWLSNLRFIRAQNSQSHHYKCGLNKFACLTPSEYRLYLSTKSISQTKLKSGETIMAASPAIEAKFRNDFAHTQRGDDPDELDYRNHDPAVLNAIQDVGSCSGSDWAFSVTACVEANYALSWHRTLYKLSEQCLIDCVEYCDGCNSCEAYSAFSFITGTYESHLNFEQDYPWVGSKTTCQFDKEKSVSLYSGVLWGHDNPESDMIHWLNTYGVGAVRLDASLASFQLYSSGVYDDKNCGTKPNLDVNVVGYGTLENVPFWICRNNWGISWGESGYFRLLRGSNQCGIATVFGFPAVFS